MGYSEQSEYPGGIFFQAALGAGPVDVPSTTGEALKVAAVIVTDTVAATVTLTDDSGTILTINVLAGDTVSVEQGFTTDGQLQIGASVGTPDVTILYWFDGFDVADWS